MTNVEIIIPERLLKEREVCEMVGISNSTLWRWVEAGLFPAQIRIGPRAVRWRLSEVLAWIASRPTVTG